MSNLSFWETRRGVQLAETLIRTLPKIAMSKKQETEKILESDLQNCIDQKLKDGYVVDHVIPLENEKDNGITNYLVIFSK